jgi:hypothetical protein
MDWQAYNERSRREKRKPSRKAEHDYKVGDRVIYTVFQVRNGVKTVYASYEAMVKKAWKRELIIEYYKGGVLWWTRLTPDRLSKKEG